MHSSNWSFISTLPSSSTIEHVNFIVFEWNNLIQLKSNDEQYRRILSDNTEEKVRIGKYDLTMLQMSMKICLQHSMIDFVVIIKTDFLYFILVTLCFDASYCEEKIKLPTPHRTNIIIIIRTFSFSIYLFLRKLTITTSVEMFRMAILQLYEWME
ncbi:hypothetical protein Tsp_08178 [Trichinella spiralis]|uniref:hypothetical protein n=1 Tax=Trichinella spiralis TaxID=6334 RepID=UPI0001EFE86C|nr:hypothetical protein Tsp_08178 [Trichinella spiralis]